MADFVTQGPSFSILASGYENLTTVSGPVSVITVENYSISGGIVTVDYLSNLYARQAGFYLDNSKRYPPSGPTVSLELGLVISMGAPPLVLPTSGQIWPVYV